MFFFCLRLSRILKFLIDLIKVVGRPARSGLLLSAPLCFFFKFVFFCSTAPAKHMNFRIRRNLQKLLAIRQALNLSNTVTRTTMGMVEEEVDVEAMDVEIPTVIDGKGNFLYVLCN